MPDETSGPYFTPNRHEDLGLRLAGKGGESFELLSSCNGPETRQTALIANLVRDSALSASAARVAELEKALQAARLTVSDLRDDSGCQTVMESKTGDDCAGDGGCWRCDFCKAEETLKMIDATLTPKGTP